MKTKIAIICALALAFCIGATSRSEAQGDSSVMSRIAAAEERQAVALDRLVRATQDAGRRCGK